MPLGRLALFLAIFVNHCPNARVEMSHTDPRRVRIIYNTSSPFIVFKDWEAVLMEDHHIGLYDDYAEIML